MLFDSLHNLLILAQRKQPSPEPPSGNWVKILFPLILMVMYGLSGLLKKKQRQAPPTSSQPKLPQTRQAPQPQPTTPSRRPSQLSTYARNKTGQQRTTDPQAQRRTAQTQPPAQRPQQRPRPAAQQQRPQQQRPQPRPAHIPQPMPQSQDRQESQGAKKVTTIAARGLKTRQAKERLNAQRKRIAKIIRNTREKQQIGSNAGKSIQVIKTEKTKQLETQTLEQAVQNKSDLARAIVYGEIIGKPLGLRTGSGHVPGLEW